MQGESDGYKMKQGGEQDQEIEGENNKADGETRREVKPRRMA